MEILLFLTFRFSYQNFIPGILTSFMRASYSVDLILLSLIQYGIPQSL
jgi:hypothetical protein